MAKRGNSEGSIYYRNSDGKWVGVLLWAQVSEKYSMTKHESPRVAQRDNR